MLRQRNLSKDFITKIIDKAAGRVTEKTLEDFFTAIESELIRHYFTRSSESNLLRIILNQFDFTFFVNECLKYPHHFEILISLSSNSNYLTDILVRNPEYFYWIVNPSVLEFNISRKYFDETLEKTILTLKSFESRSTAIRNFKRKEILRIGLKDIYLNQNLASTTKQLSELAESISAKLFDLCYAEILAKHNLKNIKNRFAVFSLGKLGGVELNYSSDIDLVAFYDKNSFIDKKVYFNQLLTEAILLFIDTASRKTGAGFLYRVDFRLRPDGRNAPLCGSYLEYLKYYEMRGEDWERQMLIKANYLCGSKNLYNKFFNYLSKFIYPTSFTVSPIEQIKKLKSSIERRNKSESNIKLTPGGIRDIEFSVQALQLINGGKDDSLKTGNTLTAIDFLENKNILSSDEAKIFRDSYVLYRKAEHYLQLMNDQQTHDIPDSGETAEKLAHFLGSRDLKEFGEKISVSKEKVNLIYNNIFASGHTETDNTQVREIIFSDEKRSRNNLEYLRTGKSLLEKKLFDSRTMESYEKIEPKIIDYLVSSVQPDYVLENFSRIIRSALFPHIWYEEFQDTKFLNLNLLTCEFSQKAIDLFAEDKQLRDEFLSRDSLISLFQTDLKQLSLKQFHFRSSLQLAASILKPENFSELYSSYLSDRISALISTFCSEKPWNNNFIVLTMGSFGSKQLSFSSDIDLIFIVKGIESFPSIQSDFQKLLVMIRENLPGLEIDCRLRPEGKSSQLVWDVEEYKKYFQTRARIWELQAFIKCRLLLGNEKIFTDFLSGYISAVKTKDQKIIVSEMHEMRKKLLPINDNSFNIKKSFGGLYDIDFVQGYFLLMNPEQILDAETKKINSENSILTELNNNFNFLKSVELINQNIFNTKLAKLPTEEIKLRKISIASGFVDNESFTNKLNKIIQSNKKYFQQIFNK